MKKRHGIAIPTVYFAQAGDGGHVKIGYTGFPTERYQELQTDNSLRVTIIASFPGSKVEEKALHVRFNAHRIRGEWFHPVPELLETARVLDEKKTVDLLERSLNCIDART